MTCKLCREVKMYIFASDELIECVKWQKLPEIWFTSQYPYDSRVTRTNIYNLGIILWKLSSGRPSFLKYITKAFDLAQINLLIGKRRLNRRFVGFSQKVVNFLTGDNKATDNQMDMYTNF
ncbi:kinase-like domain-containing protein [Rhizophagus clarus]|uniref:Kinase-like domain-containing protein n=1 Tax=Rhizophagus clarus TaxID=94130 RepID=A0A8H3QKV2_9GLOM|nr:kinase-like domain-containing protein [Rhizophagus clarus]